MRRSIAVLCGTAIIAFIVKLRSDEQSLPLEGGWRELSGPDFI